MGDKAARTVTETTVIARHFVLSGYSGGRAGRAFERTGLGDRGRVTKKARFRWVVVTRPCKVGEPGMNGLR